MCWSDACEELSMNVFQFIHRWEFKTYLHVFPNSQKNFHIKDILNEKTLPTSLTDALIYICMQLIEGISIFTRWKRKHALTYKYIRKLNAAGTYISFLIGYSPKTSLTYPNISICLSGVIHTDIQTTKKFKQTNLRCLLVTRHSWIHFIWGCYTSLRMQ